MGTEGPAGNLLVRRLEKGWPGWRENSKITVRLYSRWNAFLDVGIEPVKIGYYRAGTDERSAQIFDNDCLSGGKVCFPMTFPAERNQVFLDIRPQTTSGDNVVNF